MNQNELEFSVFCIESIAERLNIDGKAVYNLLTSSSKILDEYIIPSYEPLHTQGKEYIVNDIVEYMQKEGLVQ